MSGSQRRPAHLEFVGGRSPRQRIWEQLRRLQPISLPDLIQSFSVADGRITCETSSALGR